MKKSASPQRIDTHRPDSLQMLMPELGWSRKGVSKNGRPKTGPGLRRYRPGITARIELLDGKPVLLESSFGFWKNPRGARPLETYLATGGIGRDGKPRNGISRSTMGVSIDNCRKKERTSTTASAG